MDIKKPQLVKVGAFAYFFEGVLQHPQVKGQYGIGLFLEEAVVKALETLTVTCFILSHFMNGVMDSVEVKFLGAACYAHLVFVGTCLGSHTLLKVGLGIPDYLTEKFGKLGSMLSFFPSVALESLCDFGISLAVGLTRHSEIHAHFAALTVEVCGKVLDHLLVAALCYTYFVFGYKCKGGSLVKFFKLAAGCAAYGALFGSFITFMNVTTHCANKFLFHCLLVIK